MPITSICGLPIIKNNYLKRECRGYLHPYSHEFLFSGAGLSDPAIIGMSVAGGTIAVAGVVLLLVLFIRPTLLGAGGVAVAMAIHKGIKNLTSKRISPKESDKTDQTEIKRTESTNHKPQDRHSYMYDTSRSYEALSRYYKDLGTSDDVLVSYFDSMIA